MGEDYSAVGETDFVGTPLRGSYIETRSGDITVYGNRRLPIYAQRPPTVSASFDFCQEFAEFLDQIDPRGDEANVSGYKTPRVILGDHQEDGDPLVGLDRLTNEIKDKEVPLFEQTYFKISLERRDPTRTNYTDDEATVCGMRLMEAAVKRVLSKKEHSGYRSFASAYNAGWNKGKVEIDLAYLKATSDEDAETFARTIEKAVYRSLSKVGLAQDGSISRAGQGRTLESYLLVSVSYTNIAPIDLDMPKMTATNIRRPGTNGTKNSANEITRDGKTIAGETVIPDMEKGPLRIIKPGNIQGYVNPSMTLALDELSASKFLDAA